ncbi:uncharacterized protein LOC120348181 isoform X1 [Styela clava]
MKFPIQHSFIRLILLMEACLLIKGEDCRMAMVCDGKPTWKDVNKIRQCTKEEKEALDALTEQVDETTNMFNQLRKTLEDSNTNSVPPSVVGVKETTTPLGYKDKETSSAQASTVPATSPWSTKEAFLSTVLPQTTKVEHSTALTEQVDETKNMLYQLRKTSEDLNTNSVPPSVDGVKETTTLQGYKDKETSSAQASTVPATSPWSTKEAFLSTVLPQTTKVEHSTENLLYKAADCSEYKENLSRLGRRVSTGNETIYITLDGEIANVNCIFDESNAWTVIQRRMDGSVDFYRGWEDYKNGFGNPDGELWLGLDKLHKMTSRKSYSLRIDLLNWEGEKRNAGYSTFRIGDEDSNYRLTVSGYSGNATDGMSYHNAEPFSTHDRDSSSSNCAVLFHGAWWYNDCYKANLNGKYYKSSAGPGGNGVSWQFWDGDDYSLKFVQMKIKPN